MKSNQTLVNNNVSFKSLGLIVSVLFQIFPVSSGAENPTPNQSPRQRVALVRLSEDAQAQVRTCQGTWEKLSAAAPDQRPAAARDLLDQASELTAKAPDYFLGWVWLAQASLVLNDVQDGQRAGTNMIALGVVANRKLLVLALMAALEKRGWLPVTPNPGSETRTGESPPGMFKPSASNFTAEEHLEFDTLRTMAMYADKTTDADRTSSTGKFLTRSKAFLDKHPDEFSLWLLRAYFCLHDDRSEEGVDAAQNLKRLGGIESTNPEVHQIMIALNVKEWLQNQPEPSPTGSVTKYSGEISSAGDSKADQIPCSVDLDASGSNGTITFGSKVGDTVVQFSGKRNGHTLTAHTGDVVSKPARVKWEAETFTLAFSADGTTAVYKCDLPGSDLTGTLTQPQSSTSSEAVPFPSPPIAKSDASDLEELQKKYNEWTKKDH